MDLREVQSLYIRCLHVDNKFDSASSKTVWAHLVFLYWLLSQRFSSCS